jgi:hypothetical protein
VKADEACRERVPAIEDRGWWLTYVKSEGFDRSAEEIAAEEGIRSRCSAREYPVRPPFVLTRPPRPPSSQHACNGDHAHSGPRSLVPDAAAVKGRAAGPEPRQDVCVEVVGGTESLTTARRRPRR